MRNILTFSLFEARYSGHFNDRFKERIKDLKELTLDTKNKDVVEAELESEIGPNWKDLLILSIISNTDSRVLRKIKLENYANNVNFGVPISFLCLKHKGKLHPIEITTYSSSSGDGEDDIYKGSQIYVAVGQDIAWTIKVFPKDKSRQSISDNLRYGVATRFKGNPYIFVEPGSDYKSIFEWDPKKGKFITGEEEKERDLVPFFPKIEIQFTLSPGTDIGYYSKLTDSIVKAKIVGVINKDTYKTSKEFQLEILKSDGTKSIKKLKSGDEVYFPIGKNKSLTLAKVADPIYVSDDRISSPIIKLLIGAD